MQQAEEREKATGSRFSIVYDALEDVPLVALWARFIALSTFGWNGYIMYVKYLLHRMFHSLFYP